MPRIDGACDWRCLCFMIFYSGKDFAFTMMLQRTQAVRALQDGCSRLGLASSTATALVQFLTVKRTHDQFVGDQDRELRMSPGAGLDRLWHWMLLNTAGTDTHLLPCRQQKYLCIIIKQISPPPPYYRTPTAAIAAHNTHPVDFPHCPLQCPPRSMSWLVVSLNIVALTSRTCQTTPSCCSACMDSTSCAWRDWSQMCSCGWCVPNEALAAAQYK